MATNNKLCIKLYSLLYTIAYCQSFNDEVIKTCYTLCLPAKDVGRFERVEAKWGDIAEGANSLWVMKFHWQKFSCPKRSIL